MDWCWSWTFNTLATWCKEPTHWKRPWCWERLKAGEGDDRGQDGWMASLTRWTWVWASFESWWWTGKLGVLQSMGSQSVGHNWVTEQTIELVSAKHQHESAIGTHMSPPSWTSLPLPSPSHPSRLLQSPALNALSHRANSHWLSILHMVIYMFPFYSLCISHPLPPAPAPCPFRLFSMSLSPLLPSK